MNDADRKAFEAAMKHCPIDVIEAVVAAKWAWKSCCEWRDSQVGEPIGFLFQHEETGLTEFIDPQQIEWGFEKNNPRWQKIGPVYTTPPTAQINQQLISEALESVETVLNDAYHRHFAECCGNGQGGCCGDFIEQWTAEDHKILDTLSPIHRKLQAAIQAARDEI